MAISFYTSNFLSSLTETFADQLNKNNEVFRTDYAVVTNNGIKKKLKIKVAEQNGIAANLSFQDLDGFIKTVYNLLKPTNSNKKYLTVDHILWIVFNELSDPKFKKLYPEQFEYYQGDQMKRHALALRIAGLFEVYLEYIPEKLDQSAADWQGYLWKRLHAKCKQDYVTINQIKETILTELKDINKLTLLQEKLPLVHFFLDVGCSNHYSSLLKEIGRNIDLNFYHKEVGLLVESTNPNSLLRSWGEHEKSLLTNLFDGCTINNISRPSISKSLLQKLQSDIVKNEDCGSNYSQADITDDSIIVNNCYTPAREVEVLYNYLVKTISESKGSLGVRDVLVLMPSTEDYIPAIKGVFESAKEKLPYSIMDVNVSSRDSMVNAFSALLDIQADCKSEIIMQLLEYKPIRKRFEIQDLDKLRNLVSDANIRFGIDGSRKNETHTVSWRTGLQRLIYGFCISGEPRYEVADGEISLLDRVEGTEAMDLIRLQTFFETLVRFVDTREEDRTLSNWTAYFISMVKTCMAESENDDASSLYKSISEGSLFSDHLNEKLSYSVFSKYLKTKLSQVSGSTRYASGGINFCSMHETRNVPFKVIAILGMNLNSFPRKETLLSYDLTSKQSVEDIRSKKEQDKFLFLQTLLSADEKLYVSYIGKNDKNNGEIPPSSLVDGLLDYIDRATGTKVGLVQEHPLHGFSNKYFDGKNDRLYTYLYDLPAKVSLPGLAASFSAQERLTIVDFLLFYKNPFQFHYNRILGIYYGEESEILRDSEVFDLDNLQKWMLKSRYVNEIQDEEDLRRDGIENGQLPLQNVGRIVMGQALEEVRELQALFELEKGTHLEEQIDISYTTKGSSLVGKVGNVYGDKLIVNTVSTKERAVKYYLPFYISWLLLKVSNNAKEGVFLADGKAKRIPVDFLTKKEAVKELEMLIKIFGLGYGEILPFTMELRWKTLKAISSLKVEEAQSDVLNEIENNDYASEYIKMECRNGFFDRKRVKELQRVTDVVLSNLKKVF